MARGDRYRCSKCGYRFVSYQQDDGLGPVGGCENCGSTKIHQTMGFFGNVGCLLSAVLFFGGIAAVIYWLFF